MHKFPSTLSLLLCALCFLFGCNPSLDTTSNLTEAQQRELQHAIAGLKASADLEVSLFAGEPMLFNPTNMDIDDRGRVWVIEAQNYRNFFNPINPIREEGDRILILEDTDQDGKADKQTVFYQGRDIDAALGIAVIDDKVIVSCSPNVWVFTDADGDDVPEQKKAMFTGIQGVQDDHGIHAFVFGPDGRLYFNHGNAGKSIKGPAGEDLYDKASGQILDVEQSNFQQGMIYRTELEGREVEVLAHNFRNNYEVCLDSYGGLWQSDNDDDGHRGVRINYVLEYGNYGYKDELTGAGWFSYRTGMSDKGYEMHWHQNDPGVVPNLLPTGAGSPTGITFYEGELLAENVQHAPLHTDAGPRVLRAYPFEVKGAGYEAEMEPLLESVHDKWFRPADVCVAPDGSVFIADWYDPGVGGNHMGDFQQGRIYRLAPENHPYQVTKPDYNSPLGAVKALSSPNLATRAKAWLKLAEMGPAAENALAQQWHKGPSHQRARALWLLARLPERGDTYIQEALADQDPNLRITALRVARQLGQKHLAYLAQMADDKDPQVRREVAIALRFEEGTQADQIWARCAERLASNDRWYLEALGIGADQFPDARFTAWLALNEGNWDTAKGRKIVWRIRAKAAIDLLGELIKGKPAPEDNAAYFRAFDFHQDSSKNEVLLALLEHQIAEDPENKFRIISHMDGEAVQNNPLSRVALNEVIENLKGSDRYFDLVARLNLTGQADNLLGIALDPASGNQSARAARLLAKLGQINLLAAKINTASPSELRPVFTSLGHINSIEALDILQDYALDSTHPLGLRKKAISSLASGWNGETRMVELLEADALPYQLGELGATQLLSVWRAQYRTIASKYLKMDEAADEIAPIHELIKLEGNPSDGKVVYSKYCASCHQAEGQGIAFGPSLNEIGNKLSQDALYASIIKPSVGISFGYEAYLLELTEGTIYQGYIASRTDEAIELMMMGGVPQSVPKEKIKSLEAQEQSLMTAGLHKLMGQEDLVHLVAYLSGLKGEAL
ncbi:MAG: PVC-type heme-binding CxxCH protein [Bacteroidota bacterium]